MVITDKTHALYGFHDTYANPAALKALRLEGVRGHVGRDCLVALLNETQAA